MYIDFLSPPITLYHLENRTHTSKIGGSFVLIMLFLIISYISFLSYDLITHKDITSIFHKQFQLEAGYCSFNSSSIFNFIQIISSKNGEYSEEYNSKYIRIYITYAHLNNSDSNLDLYDHWVFDTCQNNDYKDLDSSLFSNIINFTNSACIKYYYNSTEKKYYSLGDKNFFWPFLEHGLSQKNNIYLTTTVQKCTNYTILKELLGECPTQKEIDDYLSKNYLGIYLYFTDIQVDPSNYNNPIKKYFQLIRTEIGKNEEFVENYIYYSPLKIRTKEGTIFGKIKDINTFYFDYNKKGSNDNNGKYFTLAKYYHLMQNNVQIYERIYKNAFDIFSEIGGAIQIVFYTFFWINFVYNKYIVAYDTYSLFFFVQDKDLNKKKGLKNIFYNFRHNQNNDGDSKRFSLPHIDHNLNLKNVIQYKGYNNNHSFENNEPINIQKKRNVISNPNLLFNKCDYNTINNRIDKVKIDEDSSGINLQVNKNIIINKIKVGNNTNIGEGKNIIINQIINRKSD